MCASAIKQAEPPIPGDTGAPGGDLPQRGKNPPPTTLGSLREVIRDRSAFSGAGAGMTTPPSVVDGCAKPSVGEMAAWRHTKVASLLGAIGFGAAGPASHLPRPELLWPRVTSLINAKFIVIMMVN